MTVNGTLDVDTSVEVGSIAGAGTIDVAATLTAGADNTSTEFSGDFNAAAGGFTKKGIGTLILSGTNAFTGTTTVDSGVLKASSAGALPSNSAIVINASGTLDISFSTTAGSTQGVGDLILNDSGAGITYSTGNDNSSTTLSGDISGSGNLEKVGAGDFTISGNNTYTGETLVSAGSLIGSTSAFPGNIIDNATVKFDQSTDGTFSDVISGTGSVEKIGVGIVAFTGANTYQGATTVSAGELTLSATNTLSTFTAMTIDATVNVNFSNSVGSIAGSGATVISSNSTFTSGEDNTSTSWSGDMSGAGAFEKVGTGVLTLAATNTFTGATTVTEGELVLGAANSLSTTSPVTVAASALLSMTTDTTVASLAGAGSVDITGDVFSVGSGNTSTAFSGTIDGSRWITN